jgi:predicted amino acid dehydrogenase
MGNSTLVTYKKISPNRTSPRNHKIDTITIHCYVGQVTAKQACDYLASASAQASANYVVGYDGSIGLCVEEKDRSWCSSNKANDHRAITIEVASDRTHPYAVKDKAYNALINLLVDICKRNGIKKLLWQADKALIGQVTKQNMTVHRWFASKACPGDYLYNKHKEIANEVNKKLSANSTTASTLSTDLNVLVKHKVINSPDYWKATAPTVKYLPELIHNMAEKLK